MGFNTGETSDQDGRTIALYEFQVGDTDTFFRYTAADRDITIGTGDDEVTYTAVAIGDEGASQGGGDGNSDTMAITIDCTLDLATLYDGPPPSDKVWVTKRELQADDEDGEAIVRWKGSVGSTSWRDAASKTLNCKSMLTSLSSGGLRLCWERNCPHMLYGPGCGLDKEDFAYDTVISLPNIGGFGIIPILSDGMTLAGGFFTYTGPRGFKERRFIYRYDAAFLLAGWPGTAYYIGATPGLVDAQAIRVYPGCDHTDGTQGCGFFDNHANFGGFKYQPGKNPFGGDPVF